MPQFHVLDNGDQVAETKSANFAKEISLKLIQIEQKISQAVKSSPNNLTQAIHTAAETGVCRRADGKIMYDQGDLCPTSSCARKGT